MFKNYFKIAWRNLKKNISFSLIKIFGLALGISLFLVLLTIINDQLSYDKFHPTPEKVYRINTEALRKSGGSERYASAPYPLGAFLKDNYPAIENMVRLNRSLSADALYEGKRLGIRGFFTDPSFFEMFGYEFLHGNKKFALQETNSIVLTQETSEKFFGKENPVGKIIELEGLENFTVTGVLKKAPGKTHLEFEALGSTGFLTSREGMREVTTDWRNYYGTYLYVQIKDANAKKIVEDGLAKAAGEQYAKLELESRDKGYSFFMQSLNKIVPGPILSNHMGRALPSQLLWVIGVLALIVLISAAFNYNSLVLAQSLSRAKEIGIRKTNGALRHQLIGQFLIESVLTSLLAFLVASLIFLFLLKPFFEGLTIFQEFDVALSGSLLLYIVFAGFSVVVGLITGLFPAFYLSSFTAIQALKDLRNKTWLPKLGLRKVLLVTQFSAALLFVILLINVYRQMTYVMNADYGFKKDNILNVELQRNDYQKVKEAFAQNHNVVNISGISHNLGTSRDHAIDVRLKETDDKLAVRDYTIDANYMDNIGLNLIAGKKFSSDLPINRELFVITNENFLQSFKLGTASDAIGKTIILEDSIQVSIIGVVKDFHFRPFTYNIEPLLLRYNPGDISQLNIQLSGINNEQAIAELETIWKSIDKSKPFVHQYFAEELKNSYREFKDVSNLLAMIAFMAVTVACLGFLGLVIFILRQRIKEISIRKVLGASAGQLTFLISKSFLKILFFTCLIGLPASIWINSMFMQTFAYRVNPLVSYIGGLALLVLIALITIGTQIIRVVITNPVNSLRSE